MPHQCVRCTRLYPDGSKELLTGCECGGRFFFYVKPEAVKEAQKLVSSLSEEEKTQMETDVLEIIGDVDDDKPIVLDLESIKVLKPGKYELDLVDIFKGKPLVYKLEEGKYFIDVVSTFEAKDLSDKKKEEK